MKSNQMYFSLLKKQFPSIESAITEIINLEAIRNLPKGTEHFISDIHGEYKSFSHILRTASGVIKKKVEETFKQSLPEEEKDDISILISYPEEIMELIKDRLSNDYMKEKLEQLLAVLRVVTSKYTRSKVRKALPVNFGYIIEELLHENDGNVNKKYYHNSIINTIIEKNEGVRFIISLAKFIQKMVVDKIHILGDLFDRGPGADIILDNLIEHHNVDFVWGNHDILWLGAASGNLACIANCIRISLRYANHEMLREGYGIDISPLASLAYEKYADCDSQIFKPHISLDEVSAREFRLMTAMHKAIAIIQLKLEAQIIKNNPEFNMDDREILDKIDFKDGFFYVKDKKYKLKDNIFPTIDYKNPFELDESEEFVMKNLYASFLNSEKLQKHANFLMEKGSMYLIYNGNLLFHGCIPLKENGDFQDFEFEGKKYSGKSLLNYFDRKVRSAFYSRNDKSKMENNIKNNDNDIFWYLWCGKDSPLFGKKKMSTFERYYLEEKELHEELKNDYYKYRDNPEIAAKILNEFSIEDGLIINGHVPVKVKKGESPIKADGKLLVIDGGMAKAYQKETGIAGYTLIYSSNHLLLAEHRPLPDIKEILKKIVKFNEIDLKQRKDMKEKDMKEEDIKDSKEIKEIIQNLVPEHIVVKEFKNPVLIKDTDIGKELKMQINALEDLIENYKQTVRT